MSASKTEKRESVTRLRVRHRSLAVSTSTTGIVIAAAAVLWLFILADRPVRILIGGFTFAVLATIVALLERRVRYFLGACVSMVSAVPLVAALHIAQVAEVLPFHTSQPNGSVSAAVAAASAILFGTAAATRSKSFSAVALVLGASAIVGIAMEVVPSAALTSRVWLGCTLVALLGTCWPLFRESAGARVVARSLAGASSFGSLIVSPAAWPALPGGTYWAFIFTGLVLAAHLWHSPVAVTFSDAVAPRTEPIPIRHRTGSPTRIRELGAWKLAMSIGLGLAFAGAAATPAAHLSDFSARLIVPTILSGVGAVSLAVLARQTQHLRSSPGLTVASLIVLAVGALTVIPSLGLGMLESTVRIAQPNFSSGAFTRHPLVFPDTSPSAWLVVAILTASLSAVLAVWNRLSDLHWIPLLSGAFTAFVAQAGASSAAASTGIVAAATAAAVFVFARAPERRAVKIVGGLSAFFFAVLGFVTSATSVPVWVLSAIVALVSLIMLRVLIGARVSRRFQRMLIPPVTVTAGLILLVSARWTSSLLASPSSAATAFTTVLVACCFIAAGAIMFRSVIRLDGQSLAGVGALGTIFGFVEVVTVSSQGSHTAYIASLVALLLAEIAWLPSRGGRERFASFVAAVATPPTAALLGGELWRAIGPAVWGAPELIAVCICLLLAAVGVFAFRYHSGSTVHSRTVRLAWDSSIILTSIVTVPAALTSSDFGALNILALGLMPLCFSLGPSTDSAGPHPRSLLAWGALPGVATAAWLALRELEIYTPVALALTAVTGLALAFILMLISMSPGARRRSPWPNLLIVSTLAFSLLPISVATLSRPEWLGPLVLSTALLIAVGLAMPNPLGGIHLGLWCWLTGTSGFGLAALLRCIQLVDEPVASWGLLAWSLLSGLVLCASGLAWQKRHPRHFRLARLVAGCGPAMIGIPLAFAVSRQDAPALTVVLCGFSLGALTGFPQALVRSTALGAAAFLAIGVLVGDSLPVEVATLSFGAVALARGLREWRASGGSSWHHIGISTAFLLGPSLFAAFLVLSPLRLAGLVLIIAGLALGGMLLRARALVVSSALAATALGIGLAWPAVSEFTPGWAIAALFMAAFVILLLTRSSPRSPVARSAQIISRMH